MKRGILAVVLIALIVLTAVWVVGAQRPEPPPPPALPDTDRSSAVPGATRTPSPDEKAPDDIIFATVTPIPFKEVIDRSNEPLPESEKCIFVVRKENGDYIKILFAPGQLEDLQKDRDLTSVLGLSSHDEIVNFIPPAKLMMKERPRSEP
jgi:hypothetical protein